MPSETVSLHMINKHQCQNCIMRINLVIASSSSLFPRTMTLLNLCLVSASTNNHPIVAGRLLVLYTLLHDAHDINLQRMFGFNFIKDNITLIRTVALLTNMFAECCRGHCPNSFLPTIPNKHDTNYLLYSLQNNISHIPRKCIRCHTTSTT